MNMSKIKTNSPQQSVQTTSIAQIQGLNLCLEGHVLLQQIDLQLMTGMNVLIGPSGAGKSTLLRCLNRLEDRWQGQIHVHGQCLRDTSQKIYVIRRKIGLINQKPTVFPCSIRDNVLFGLSKKERKNLSEKLLKTCLQQAALWSELKHRLDDTASKLSLGQQQRLCIARALALKPDILMLDEPTSSLDPRSKQLIEQTLLKLAEDIPIVWVSHDLEQAKRLAGQLIFMCQGRVMECGDSKAMFQQPQCLQTQAFLRWEVCDCDS